MLSLARALLFVALFWAQQADGAYDATVCGQKSYTSRENMTFNPNAWNPDGYGFQCMSVQDSPPAFEATWAWIDEPQSVHSYPHVKLATDSLPVPLSEISALSLSAKWSIGPGSAPLPVLQLNTTGLEDEGVTANVAFDMFADRIPDRAGNATTAETEIMIWRGTHVFTWVATTNEADFAADVSPLLQSLWRSGLVAADSYLGPVEFGSEAFHSPTNVTFAASDFFVVLDQGTADSARSMDMDMSESVSGPASTSSARQSEDSTTRDPFQDPSDASFQSAVSRRTSDENVIPRVATPPPVVLPSHRQDREQILPLGGEPDRFQEKPRHTSRLDIAQVNPETAVDPEKGDGALSRRANLVRRLYAAFRRTYCPEEEPGLVMPTGPTDEEKLKYISTNRLPIYIIGMFSFLTLSAGMWLFTLCAPIFYWYGVFVLFLNVYLSISYFVGILGKDWDYAGHQRLVAEYPITDETAPTVDVYLPCCSEPLEILENTYQHVMRLDWPAHKLKVYVLDDGNQPAVRALAASYGFGYIVRDDRPRLRKAGNLRWAFARTHGDFFAIFDADFCPRQDFVRELVVQHLADERTAIVQSPQYFRVTGAQTWVEQGAGATQELFYRVVQVNRNRWGASICVGSNALYRRAALEEVGGTAEIGFSEDVHTGFDATDRGWKVKYVPLCLATGICPNTPRSFFSQQMRWARGSTTLLTTKRFWVSNLTLMQKVCYLCGLLYYSAVSLGIFISPIPGTLVLIFRPQWFHYYNLAFAVPSIIYGSVIFRFWAKAEYGLNVQHVMVLQSYAYLTAIKDRLFGIELLWAASGDRKAHKSNKYRNMRLLCWFWSVVVTGGMVAAVTYRLVNGFPWYHTIPLILLNLYNLFVTHYFLFASWAW
ncbi:hypothetical protein QBC47DRAFT_460200 [Echria macrotheca]|uniref:Glycosyltransferase 2-like domain-containing protein n=1 Tax=Echria macrotheca TaxID=438768 RepID=A0AAJ0BE76_9PEZI|nr:hypothetical protein QBC47DRAFT_460200 [Echria macrotheca]